MGRPVWKNGGARPPSATSDFVVAEMYARASTTWKSTVVTQYPYPYIPIQGQDGAVWKLRVSAPADSARDVFEFRIARGYLEPTVFVLPFGSGIRFADGTRLHWNLSANASQFWCSASWIGVED